MRRTLKNAVGLLAGCALAGSLAYGAEPTAPVRTDNTGSKILVAKTFRASKLMGMSVRNAEGEKLGTIEDLVMHLENGKVAYAALGVGGVLGIGEKLFAIPYSQLKFNHGKDEMFFVLNMSKEKLKTAPGFDKSNWPDVADPKWAEEIDTYYRQAQTPDGVRK